MKIVIFDLNGLFIQSPFLSDRFQADFDVPVDEFMPVLDNIMHVVRRPGAESLYSYWQSYLEKWNVKFSQPDFYDYWFTAEKVNNEMVELAEGLKADGWNIVILSNNFRERASFYDTNFPFLKLFDKIYYSWQTGFVKPDERCFTQILRDYKAEAEDCCFFDDSSKNVEVAKKLGFNAFKFKDVEQVKSQLS